jgi:transcriptional regulator ATRX
MELSGKFLLVKGILDECESIGDKVLLFSRSLITLDYIELWLASINETSSSLKWQKGFDYFRIDGKELEHHSFFSRVNFIFSFCV